MKNLSIKALNIETWKDFERLVQKHNGVWGGCWCTAFHPKSPLQKQSAELTKSYKKSLSKKKELMLPWSLMEISVSPGANLAHLRSFPISITEKKLSPE